MTLDLAGTLADAAAMLRRDRAVLPWIAGTFFFLPQFALALFLPDVQVAENATDSERLRAILDSLESVFPWLMLSQFVQFAGIAALMHLYLAPVRPSVGGAIGDGLRALPVFALAMFIANLAVLGGLLLILPGLYLIGRLFLLAPVLVAERDQGFAAALPRAFDLSRGRGWLLLALAATVYLPGQLVALVAAGIRAPAGAAGVAAEVTTAFGSALGAGAGATVTLMLALLQIVVYQRLAARQGM